MQKPILRLILGVMVVIFIGEKSDSQTTLRFSGIKGSVNHKVCVKILTEVYEVMGIQVSDHTFPAKRALILSNSGEFDGEVQRIDHINKDYPNLVKIPESIFFLEGSVFLKDIHISFDGWGDLRQYRIGIPRGIKYLEANTQGMNRLMVDSVDQLFHLLDAERVDVVIIATNFGQAFLKKNKELDIKMMTPPIIIIPLYHYLHKKHSAMVPDITGIIKTMKKEGRIDEIIEKSSKSE